MTEKHESVPLKQHRMQSDVRGMNLIWQTGENRKLERQQYVSIKTDKHPVHLLIENVLLYVLSLTAPRVKILNPADMF